MLTPHSALTIAATLLAGVAMLRVSLGTRSLGWRQPPRCPSCGRQTRRGGCGCAR